MQGSKRGANLNVQKYEQKQNYQISTRRVLSVSLLKKNHSFGNQIKNHLVIVIKGCQLLKASYFVTTRTSS